MGFGGVLVVGSANMDLVVRTPHFAQPGQTVLGSDFSTFPGGKGANQAVAVGKLGGRVHFVGKVGGDTFGQELLRSLMACGVNTGLTTLDPNLSTGVALITVEESGQNSIIVAPGANGALTPEDVAIALEEEFPAVLLVQLEVPMETVRAAVLGAVAGTVVILNPAPARAIPTDILARVDYLTPNESEAEVLTGIRPTDEESAHAAAQALRSMGARNVIVTMGEAGAYLLTEEGGRMFSTFPVLPVDTTAAGDAFNGAFARFLSWNYPPDRAIYLANAVGALTTTKMGAQISMPTLREVEQFAPMLFAKP